MMKKTNYCFLALSIVFLLINSCVKTELEYGEPADPYIKNFIEVDTTEPYTGEYYLYAKFNHHSYEQKELYFNMTDHKFSVVYTTDNGQGMLVQGIALTDTTTYEQLEITFYMNLENSRTFHIYYADYYYADPWNNNKEGVQFSYFVPVSESDPYSMYRYLGSNTSDSYFNIEYIGSDRINGTFRTFWKECCGGNMTYDVYGEFSIPTDKLYNIDLHFLK